MLLHAFSAFGAINKSPPWVTLDKRSLSQRKTWRSAAAVLNAARPAECTEQSSGNEGFWGSGDATTGMNEGWACVRCLCLCLSLSLSLPISPQLTHWLVLFIFYFPFLSSPLLSSPLLSFRLMSVLLLISESFGWMQSSVSALVNQGF